MGFFDRTLYLRAVFYVLPLGLGLMYIGLRVYFMPIKKLEELKYIQGKCSIVANYHYDPNTEKDEESYIVTIKDINQEFYIPFYLIPDSLKPMIPKLDSVSIWTDGTDLIERLDSNGKTYRDYEIKRLWLLGVVLFGAFTAFIALGHIIKHRSVLFGGHDNHNEKTKKKGWTWF